MNIQRLEEVISSGFGVESDETASNPFKQQTRLARLMMLPLIAIMMWTYLETLFTISQPPTFNSEEITAEVCISGQLGRLELDSKIRNSRGSRYLQNFIFREHEIRCLVMD